MSLCLWFHLLHAFDTSKLFANSFIEFADMEMKRLFGATCEGLCVRGLRMSGMNASVFVCMNKVKTMVHVCMRKLAYYCLM